MFLYKETSSLLNLCNILFSVLALVYSEMSLKGKQKYFIDYITCMGIEVHVFQKVAIVYSMKYSLTEM